MEYGKKILQIRAKLNMSQEELGKAVGVSFSTVNRWENNKSIPTKKHLCVLENLCEEYNLNIEVQKNAEK